MKHKPGSKRSPVKQRYPQSVLCRAHNIRRIQSVARTTDGHALTTGSLAHQTDTLTLSPGSLAEGGRENITIERRITADIDRAEYNSR